MPVPSGQTMGWLRGAVGVALITAPRPFLRLSGAGDPTGPEVLLLRTIGIRDLVLGVGTVVAARRGGAGDARRWTVVGLASDVLDVVASAAAGRSVGPAAAGGAALAAATFVAGDLAALAGSGRRSARGPGNA